MAPQALHSKLAAPSPSRGDAFQQSVARVAARPPWPSAAPAKPAAGMSVAETVVLWEQELGAMLEAVYTLPPDKVVLVFDWPLMNEGVAFEPFALAVVCAATAVATGGSSAATPAGGGGG